MSWINMILELDYVTSIKGYQTSSLRMVFTRKPLLSFLFGAGSQTQTSSVLGKCYITELYCQLSFLFLVAVDKRQGNSA